MTDITTLQAVGKLLDIMAILRSADGCQWDRKQTPQSLKPYILEEAYELLEAIDQGNPLEICDELGDLLLQVVFQAQIFAESGEFTLKDVATAISTKLERRHPHIFASATDEGHQQRWEKIKLQERTERGKSNKIADRIPTTLPALKRAEKFLKKTLPEGSYSSTTDVITQLELLQQINDTEPCNRAEIEAAFGHLLISISSLAQTMGIDAEDSLRMMTNQMIEAIDN